MRWWFLLLLISCEANNWTDFGDPKLTGEWADFPIPSGKAHVERVEDDHLIIDYTDLGSAQRQRLYRDWHRTLVRSGWKPVEAYGDLSTGMVKRANFHGLDDGKHGLLEVTRKGEIVRVSVRKTTVRRGWDPA